MTSSPPTGIHDYDFSYAATLKRTTGQSKFRWRLNGDEWLCDRIAGVCDMDSISQKGHITVRGELQIVEEDGQEVAYLWPDPDAEDDGDPDGKLLQNTHWRLCANLQGSDDDKWRLRDERSDPSNPFIIHVKGYKGKANVNWMDSGPHVFHDGEIILDEENIAHLR